MNGQAPATQPGRRRADHHIFRVLLGLLYGLLVGLGTTASVLGLTPESTHGLEAREVRLNGALAPISIADRGPTDHGKAETLRNASAGWVEESERLTATWIGRVGGASVATLAISWRGKTQTVIEVVDEKDGRLLATEVVEPGVQIVKMAATGFGEISVREVSAPGQDHRRTRRRAAVSLLGVEGCEWAEGFGVPGLELQGGHVEAMVVFDDGSGPALYVGGNLQSADGTVVQRIARWDGASWSPLVDQNTLVDGVDGTVSSMAVFDDGAGADLYVGGFFQNAGGAPASRMARWDGSTWSALGAGVDNGVATLAVYDDGGGAELYAGGYFNNAGGSSASRIAKWTGSAWTTVLTGANGSVFALDVYDDGAGGGPQLYVGGQFTSIGGTTASKIARWNGTAFSTLGTGVNNNVETMLVYDDGVDEVLVVGGAFTTAGGAGAVRIASWDGTWSALGSGLNANVYGLAAYDDGSGSGHALYAAGFFTTAGGGAAARVARWNGTSWTALQDAITMLDGFDDAAYAAAVYDDGGGAGPRLFVGGELRRAGGRVANGIGVWNGSEWSGVSEAGVVAEGLNGIVWALARFDDGGGGGEALYAAGDFINAGETVASRIAKWDGSGWSALADDDTGIEGTDDDIRALAVYDDGSGEALYAAGDFTMAGGAAAGGIARWDGTDWEPLVDAGTMAEGANNTVNALAAHDDGSGEALYAGGLFTSVANVTAFAVARWDGTNWVALTYPSGKGTGNGVFPRSVNALVSHNDGSGPALFVGGGFTFPAPYIGRWDGTSFDSVLDDDSSLGLPAFVTTMAVHDEGSGDALFVGGSFTSAGGNTANQIARWDGADWEALIDSGTMSNGLDHRPQTMATYDDGNGESALHVGGIFDTAGGHDADFLARWSGSTWASIDDAATMELGLSSHAYSLAVHDDGSGLRSSLFMGGVFVTAGGRAASRIARYTCPDITAPTDPAIQSTTPAPGLWSNAGQVEIEWAGAQDDGGSGLAGYSILFDQQAVTTPDDTIEVPHVSDPHQTDQMLADGDGWFFHLSTCDNALNCTDTVHAGPFRLDTAAPAAPGTFASSSHGDGQPHADATIDFSWGAATDTTSGIDGYGILINSVAVSSCDSTKDVEETELVTTSAALADGTWYAHLCAVDNAGNWGPVVPVGPLVIDLSGPTGLAVGSSSHTTSTWSSDPTIDFEFSGASDPTGITGYAVALDQSSGTAPSCSVDQTSTTHEATTTVDSDDWWLHVRAVDALGNCGTTVHTGPFWIDANAPAVISADSVPEAGIDGIAEPSVIEAVTRFLIGFDETMADIGPDSVLDTDNWQLVEAGVNEILDTTQCGAPGGDDQPVSIGTIVYEAPGDVAGVGVAAASGLAAGRYRLLACASLADVAGNPLDGGIRGAGTAWTTDLTVVVIPLADNPNFDDGLGLWLQDGPNPSDWSLGALDAESKPHSGAGKLDTVSGSGATWTLEQCIDIAALDPITISALGRIGSSSADSPTLIAGLAWWDGPACSGTEISSSMTSPLTGDSGGQWYQIGGGLIMPPAGVVSVGLFFEVVGGADATYTAEIDRVRLVQPPGVIFWDGFESGDVGAW